MDTGLFLGVRLLHDFWKENLLKGKFYTQKFPILLFKTERCLFLSILDSNRRLSSSVSVMSFSVQIKTHLKTSLFRENLHLILIPSSTYLLSTTWMNFLLESKA